MRRSVLHVAEKPSVAKALAGILGGNGSKQRMGNSRFNPIFEFSYNWKGSARKFVVTSVTGHLTETDFPPQFRDWSARDPSACFTAPIVREVKEENLPISEQLQKEAKLADTLMLWLDCDREGENICFEVIDVCKKANPRIEVWRARFASIVPREIIQACNNPVRPNESEALAVDARIELDLRTGAVWTRFLTLRYQKKFVGVEDLISYGACQFPTLGFVVHRFNQIESFVPEPFWKLVLEMEKNGKSAIFNWDRVRVFDEAICNALFDQCVKGGVATVTHVGTKPKSKFRPFPMTTVKLQQLGTSKLRMSSHQLMEISEDLYRKGLISYPRTETDSFAPGTPFQELIQEQFADPKLGAYARTLDGPNSKFREPKRGKNSDQAHTAIHPTKSGAALSGQQRAVYELIARHFLACCSDDAKGSETIVRLELGGEEFTLSGLVIHELNYLDVYVYEKWSDKDIPSFVQGEKLKPKTLNVEASVTTAPELLTEKDLITLMDKNGIGTDATIAQHITKIVERGYATKDNQYFAPTKLGLTLVNGFDRMGLDFCSPGLRADTERDMKEIIEGRMSKQQCVTKNSQAYKKLYEFQQQNISVLDAEFTKMFNAKQTRYTRRTPNFSQCGKCKGLMSLVSTDEGAQSLICEACNDTYLLEPKYECVISPLDTICPNCSFQAVEIASKFTTSVCPFCKWNPPAQFFSPDGLTTCRGCTNSACSLSKGLSQLPIRLCPVCRSHSMVLRTPKAGGTQFLSCSHYPSCKGAINFPPCQSVSLSPEKCDACSAKFAATIRKLNFTFAGTGQSQGGPLNAEYCVAGCSDYLNPMLRMANGRVENLFVAPVQQQPPPPPPPRSQSNVNLAGSFQAMKNSFQKKVQKLCNCGVEAALMTVKKEGPNVGREFYGCGNSRTCQFFEWADGEQPRGMGGGGGGGGGGFSGNNFAPSRSSGFQNVPSGFQNGPPPNSFAPSRSSGFQNPSHADVLCGCGTPAKHLVSKKEGPNQGRAFYACATPRECKFFKWADEIGQQGSSAPSASAGRGVCFNCNQPGHWSNACPNRGGSGFSAPAPAPQKRGKQVKDDINSAPKKRGRPPKSK